MYLSRLILNSQHPEAKQDQRNAYRFHQSIRWAFEGAGEPHGQLPEGERILWCQNPNDREVFFVQSQSAPNWNALEQRFRTCNDDPYFEEVGHKVYNPQGIKSGHFMLFRLRANVTVSQVEDLERKMQTSKAMSKATPTAKQAGKQAGKHKYPRSKRKGILDPAAQMDWLMQKGNHHGFRLVDADIISSGRVSLYKPSCKIPIVLHAVTYSGCLEVTDAENFIKGVRQGIGRAKALGFGLLRIQRDRA